MAKGMVTTNDVASYLACSEETVRRMARDEQIPYLKVGASYRFDLDEVMRRLAERCRQGEEAGSS